MKRKITTTEREGMVLRRIVTVANYIITNKRNKRSTRNFYCACRPVSLLSLMLRRLVLDCGLCESFTFSSLRNCLAGAVGFNKSDKDFIGTWRICNRFPGNVSLFVQSFACLEGPVAKNYENESRKIGNNDFLIKEMVSSIRNDYLYALTLETPTRAMSPASFLRPFPCYDPSPSAALPHGLARRQ